MKIKNLRNKLNISQEELSEILGVSSRTIRRYENGQIDKYKENYILNKLKEMIKIDEENGILKFDDIVTIVNDIASKYDIEYIYLFGSYAKNLAKPNSDVDLLINTNEKGLNYFGLIEEFRNKLKKKVDLIDIKELENNNDLLLEILRDGIKVYNFNKKG